MDAQVIQQEAQTVQIEQKGEEVNDNMTKANQEVNVAIKSARAARKKKWWCLFICCKSCRCCGACRTDKSSSAYHHYHRRRRGRGCEGRE